ncbi:MAG: response regulator [Thermoleophilia bacterium]
MTADQEKILVVEDNPMNLLLVKDLLEVAGFMVIPARSGQEALRVARQEHPDLILMDIQLPLMDGLEATRLLQQDEDTRDIKIVALTAHAMRGDEERARLAGCCGYIAKPINTREFVGVVRDYLSGSRT